MLWFKKKKEEPRQEGMSEEWRNAVRDVFYYGVEADAEDAVEAFLLTCTDDEVNYLMSLLGEYDLTTPRGQALVNEYRKRLRPYQMERAAKGRETLERCRRSAQ